MPIPAVVSSRPVPPAGIIPWGSSSCYRSPGDRRARVRRFIVGCWLFFFPPACEETRGARRPTIAPFFAPAHPASARRGSATPTPPRTPAPRPGGWQCCAARGVAGSRPQAPLPRPGHKRRCRLPGALLRWGLPAPRRGGSDVPGGGIEPVRGAPRRPWRLRAPRGGVGRGAAPGPGRAPLPARNRAGSSAGHGRLRTPSAQPKAVPAAAGLRAEPHAGRRLAPGPKMAPPSPVGRRAHPVPPL